MAGKEQPQIINGIIENRRAEAARKTSIEQVKEDIPAFKKKLNRLITTHISKPQVRKISSQKLFNNIGSEMYDRDHGMGKETGTILEVEIPTSEGNVDVTIRSSIYPARNLKDFERDNLSYKIDVSEMDHYLEIDDKGAKLKSKDRDSNMPRDHVRIIIGHHYDSWPRWEREPNKEEFNQYSELINLLLKPNPEIKFTGSTPDKIEIIREKAKKGTILFALDKQAKRIRDANKK